MGNEIAKKYDVQEVPRGTAGPRGVWNVYDGIERRTNTPVSVFIFDKGVLEQVPKGSREDVLNILRNDMKMLVTLRHPHVLRVIEAFEENKKLLSFVSERVTGSLANAYRAYGYGAENFKVAPGNSTFSQFELARGFSHISAALAFVHHDARMVHCDLTPESICVTEDGSFKLAGFGFALKLPADGDAVQVPYFRGTTASQSSFRAILSTTPQLRYAAPEMSNGPGIISAATDMFSFAVVIMETMACVNNEGRLDALLKLPDEQPQSHAYTTSKFNPAESLGKLPASLRPPISAMLSMDARARPSASAFSSCEYFERGPVHTMRVLEGSLGMEQGRLLDFLKQLPKLLAPFPPEKMVHLVLPHLQMLAQSKISMMATLPALLVVAQASNVSDFNTRLTPLLAMYCSPATPAGAAELILEQVPMVLDKSSTDFVRNTLAPFYCRLLTADEPALALQCTQTVDKLMSKLDTRIINADILPKLKALVSLDTAPIPLRVAAAGSIARMLPGLDHETRLNDVLPMMQVTIRSKPRIAAVVMACVECMEIIAKSCNATVLSAQIIPFLVPLLGDQAFVRAQFHRVSDLIQELLQKTIASRMRDFDSLEAAEAKADAQSSVVVPTLDVAEASALFQRPVLPEPAPARIVEPYRDARVLTTTWGPAGPSAAAPPAPAWGPATGAPAAPAWGATPSHDLGSPAGGEWSPVPLLPTQAASAPPPPPPARHAPPPAPAPIPAPVPAPTPAPAWAPAPAAAAAAASARPAAFSFADSYADAPPLTWGAPAAPAPAPALAPAGAIHPSGGFSWSQPTWEASQEPSTATAGWSAAPAAPAAPAASFGWGAPAHVSGFGVASTVPPPAATAGLDLFGGLTLSPPVPQQQQPPLPPQPTQQQQPGGAAWQGFSY